MMKNMNISIKNLQSDWRFQSKSKFLSLYKCQPNNGQISFFFPSSTISASKGQIMILDRCE